MKSRYLIPAGLLLLVSTAAAQAPPTMVIDRLICQLILVLAGVGAAVAVLLLGLAVFIGAVVWLASGKKPERRKKVKRALKIISILIVGGFIAAMLVLQVLSWVVTGNVGFSC